MRAHASLGSGADITVCSGGLTRCWGDVQAAAGDGGSV
jgi:hypothetical protein